MPAAPHRLITLGRLTLLDPTGVEHRDLATRKRKLALLTLLATSNRAWSRDALVDLFWGEHTETRARHSLSDALSHLRRILGPDAIAQRRTEVALSDDLALAVDVREFQEAVRAQEWERAVASFGGPFLDGLHLGGSARLSHWIDDEQRRLNALFGTAARAECERLLRDEAFDAVALLASRWLAVAPTSPHAALFRLRALAAAGTPEADQRALDDYAVLSRRLEQELGTRPDRTVVALMQEIAARQAARQPDPDEERQSVPVASAIAEEIERVASPRVVDVSPPSLPLASNWSNWLSRRLGVVATATVAVACGLFFWRGSASRAEQPANIAPLTSSPAAQALYDRAVIAYDRDGNRQEAIALLDSAIAYDSSFAMAYRRLGMIFDNGVDGRSRSVRMLTLAARYADRLPLAERLTTLGAYHRTVTGNFARAGSAYRALLDLNPNDARAWGSLGTIYDYLGDRARAVEAYERSLALDPKRALTWMNVADGRYTLGNVDGAWRSLDSMAIAFPGHPGLFMRTAMLAHAEGQRERTEAQLRALVSSSADNVYQRAAGEMLLAKAYWSWGRFDEGDAARRRSVHLDRARGAPDAALIGEIDLAMASVALRSDTARARRQLADALQRTPLLSLPAPDRPYLEVALAYATMAMPGKATEMLQAYRDGTDTTSRWRHASQEHHVRGAIALAQRNWRVAILELKQVAEPLCSVCGLPELAVAYVHAGHRDSAAIAYTQYLKTHSQRRLDMTDVWHGEGMRRTARALAIDTDR